MKSLFAISALAVMVVGEAQAQEPAFGREYFMEFCATCHGVDAKGGGPMVGALMMVPADLTALAAKNDGVFPAERVARRIDGRDPLVSHGSPMPVYGDFFDGSDAIFQIPNGQPMHTSRPIADLIAYLMTVQEEEQ